jgi:hypothetical protein
MTYKSSLLTNLSHQRPSEGRNPLENFITEAFAWILQSDPAFALRFLTERICAGENERLKTATDLLASGCLRATEYQIQECFCCKPLIIN